MELVLISGMSGAGKSRAASFMEDMDFFCVDNLPVPLISKFAELCRSCQDQKKYSRCVLVSDIRSGNHFEELQAALEQAKALDIRCKTLFMDAADEVIIKRYKETRRSHPLAECCDTLAEAIRQERKETAPLREQADYIIDTSYLSNAKLKGELYRLFSNGQDMTLTFIRPALS